MLSILIIVFFTLTMVSIGGIIYCMIRHRDFKLGDKFEVALMISSTIFFMLCCAFINKGLAHTHDPHPREADTIYVYPSLSERQLLILSMMDVESKFNPLAEGDSGDTGILQIRQIYVDEANRILGRKEFTLMDAYDIDRSLDMFDTVQSHHNSDNDFISTIYYHNKSNQYRDRIIQAYNKYLSYERLRQIIYERYKRKNK